VTPERSASPLSPRDAATDAKRKRLAASSENRPARSTK
jgi:hypothetical protein